MKHKNWLFGLVSVLAVVFGLSFPGITATVEDQNAGDLADFYKITNPQLAPPVLLPDVIRLISGKYTRVDLESGKVLTEDDVYRAATDAAEFLASGGAVSLPENGYDSFQTFSHCKSIVKKANWIDLPFRYHPYTTCKQRLVRLFLK